MIAGLLDASFRHQPEYILAAQLFQVLIVGLIMALILFLVDMSYGFYFEAINRGRQSNRFGQYVPPELVNEMSRFPERFTLSGEKRELTVLFSDIRGFTTLSEGLDPKELVNIMNELLTPMTRVVHRHQGTIDKYMGDALMAFWGAPVDNPNHTQSAVDAAIELYDSLTDINAEFNRRGLASINIGVGLNTGEMSVGNMGSEFRVAYTIMGDAVNLGSRLEGLTKHYGVNIIINETTAECIEGFDLRELDRVRVKGKNLPVTIFEPLKPGTVNAEELSGYHEALEHYRQQNWEAARNGFVLLLENPQNEFLYQLYLERIEALESKPPEDDWDGAFTFQTK